MHGRRWRASPACPRRRLVARLQRCPAAGDPSGRPTSSPCLTAAHPDRATDAFLLPSRSLAGPRPAHVARDRRATAHGCMGRIRMKHTQRQRRGGERRAGGALIAAPNGARRGGPWPWGGCPRCRPGCAVAAPGHGLGGAAAPSRRAVFVGSLRVERVLDRALQGGSHGSPPSGAWPPGVPTPVLWGASASTKNREVWRDGPRPRYRGPADLRCGVPGRVRRRSVGGRAPSGSDRRRMPRKAAVGRPPLPRRRRTNTRAHVPPSRRSPPRYLRRDDRIRRDLARPAS